LADQTLTDFVKVSLQSGATKGEIKTALIEAGWSGDQIADALATFSDVNFVVPIPKPKAQLSARDAFFYLVTFVTLYVSAFHLGSLLFDFVNLALPDELNSRTNRIYRDIRWATSALVVYLSHTCRGSYHHRWRPDLRCIQPALWRDNNSLLAEDCNCSVHSGLDFQLLPMVYEG